jgi:carboxyl-terminal processing protease
MKKILFAGIAVLGLTFSQAQAQIVQSPARDLYDQATFFIESEYWGFSTANFPALIEENSNELAKVCGADPQCPYSAAEPILLKLFRAIGDPHSGYANPQQAASLFGNISGGGTATPRPVWGFTSIPDIEARATRIFDVFPNSPAARAGVRYGDQIIAFNGKQFGTTQENFLTEFRDVNALGQEVTLTVKRGTETLTLKGTPAVYQNLALPWLEEIRTGVWRMRIPSFENPNTAQRIHELAAEVMTKNPSGLIIDLRDNGGGLATECLIGVGAFIGKAERIRSLRRGAGRSETYNDGKLTFKDLDTGREQVVKSIKPTSFTGKFSVLVNDGSGSCAEYFPSDVQFAKRAAIVGEKTVGVGNTGTIFFRLINGGAAQITTVKALRGDNTPYPEAVTPDVVVVDDLQTFAKQGIDAVMDAGIAAVR